MGAKGGKRWAGGIGNREKSLSITLEGLKKEEGS